MLFKQLNSIRHLFLMRVYLLYCGDPPSYFCTSKESPTPCLGDTKINIGGGSALPGDSAEKVIISTMVNYPTTRPNLTGVLRNLLPRDIK